MRRHWVWLWRNGQRTAVIRGAGLLSLLVLGACANPNAGVVVDGVRYTNPNEAIDAVRRQYERYADGLAKDNDPIKGSVRIVLPDDDRLRPLMTQVVAVKTKTTPTTDGVNIAIRVDRAGVDTVAHAIDRIGLFQSATITVQNDVREPDFAGADYVVWNRVASVQANGREAWFAQWMVRHVGTPGERVANFDAGTAPGTARYASFMTAIKDAAFRLGGKTVAGKNTPSSTFGASGAIGTGFGTGIIIATKGDILTNNHVVKGCGTLMVTGADNKQFSASVKAHDEANDLAVVTVDHRWPREAIFRDGRDVRPGDPITVTGFPLNGLVSSDMIVTTGSVSALSGPKDDSRYIQVSAPIQPGNSGGPLLDGSGDVVGVVSMTLAGLPIAIATGAVPQNVNFAIKSAVVRNFLESNSVPYQKGAPQREMSSADVADLARQFTVRIECRR